MGSTQKSILCAAALFICLYIIWEILTYGCVTWAGKINGGITFTRLMNPVGYWVSLSLYVSFAVVVGIIANTGDPHSAADGSLRKERPSV